MKFSKYNNPAKKRSNRRQKDYTDRCIDAAKEMIIDSRLGYKIPTEYYEKKYRVKPEYADSWYGGGDPDFIENSQEHGLPTEDIENFVRDFGPEVLEQLEEI